MSERIKIFLTNGYKYEGVKQDAPDGFIALMDDKDGKIMHFPTTAILSIEKLGGR